MSTTTTTTKVVTDNTPIKLSLAFDEEIHEHVSIR